MRRKKREAIANAGDHPAYGMAQHKRAFGIVGGEQVIAVFVVHRHVNMHAGACLFGKWLCHERRLKPVRLRHRLHNAFVHNRIITGAQHIGLVAQGQLALARRKFGYGRFQRKPLHIAAFV